MRIELAGVPAEVVCRFKENEAFLRDYATDKTPLFSVEASGEDCERVRQGLLRRGDPSASEAFVENNAIHALLAEALTAHNVLLMHGSALCMDGEGYLFTARSGTGKSTHARLWREAFGARVWMLNDDKPLVRVENGRATVYGSPWDGKHRLSRNACAPLKAIAALERAEENRVEPLPAAAAFETLRRRAYTSRDPRTAASVLRLEEGLLRAASFYRLRCNMNAEAALVAWRGMNGLEPVEE